MILSIRQTAELLNISLQTLRRWDSVKADNKKLKPEQRHKSTHRYYTEDAIEDFLSYNFKYLLNIGKRWTYGKNGFDMLPRLYCADRAMFKARLSKLEALLMRNTDIGANYSLITSVVGEIGNNSFDHNLGSWPDISGIFFGYNLSAKKIILADRGQGILTTLKRVKPELENNKQAIKTAFTEIISGRSPESRGNGLKYIKSVIENSKMKLFFQSGNAIIKISTKTNQLDINKTKESINGCFAIIDY